MPAVVHGGSCLDELTDAVRRFGAEKVLVMTDKGVKGAGLTQPVTSRLSGLGVSFSMFDGVMPEPSWHDVQTVLDRFGREGFGLVIAVGGGSVMDTAKLFSLLAGRTLSVRDLLNDPLAAKKALPSFMIPTTCGTGSEATANAIVAVPEEGVKVGIVNPDMIPDAVFLDSAMISSLPAPIVAATGIDALAHAVECFTSNKANPISDIYALASAKLIFRSLPVALRGAGDATVGESMLLGAFFGGAAIASSGTTAVHALSYPLGGKFHIPHGVSNAILFAPVMRFNLKSCEERLASLCDGVWPGLPVSGREKAIRVVTEIEALVRAAKIPPLSFFGVKEEDLEFLTDAGFGVKRLLNNNRRTLTRDDVRAIYLSVLRAEGAEK